MNVEVPQREYLFSQPDPRLESRRFLYFSKPPYRHWGPPGFLFNGYQVSFPGSNVAGT